MSWCEEGERLNMVYASWAQTIGRYQESLKGVARTSEHRRESKRLEEANNKARRAFEEHRASCPECSKGPKTVARF